MKRDTVCYIKKGSTYWITNPRDYSCISLLAARDIKVIYKMSILFNAIVCDAHDNDVYYNLDMRNLYVKSYKSVLKGLL